MHSLYEAVSVSAIWQILIYDLVMHVEEKIFKKKKNLKSHCIFQKLQQKLPHTRGELKLFYIQIPILLSNIFKRGSKKKSPVWKYIEV